MDPLQNLEVRSWTAPPAVVSPLTIRFEPSQITALLGPNGAGKSTVLKELFRSTGPDRSQLLGVGSTVVFPLTAYEAIALGVESPPESSVVAVARRCGIEFLLNRPMNALSGGEIQKVHLARALLRDPQVLFLDESLSRLDWGASRTMLRDLAVWVRSPHESSAPRWVIWVSHDLECVRQFADQVVWIKCGTLMGQGGAGELLSEVWLDRIYG